MGPIRYTEFQTLPWAKVLNDLRNPIVGKTIPRIVF